MDHAPPPRPPAHASGTPPPQTPPAGPGFHSGTGGTPLSQLAAASSSAANSASPAQTTSNAPAGPPSFRRQRASRACETCHARKVRCDAASLGVPCTNCVAFSIECKIPAPKRSKKLETRKGEKEDGSDIGSTHQMSPSPGPLAKSQEGTPSATGPQDSQSVGNPGSENHTFGLWTDWPSSGQFVNSKLSRAPIKEAGRVAFLGESSNFSLLVRDAHGDGDVVHYPLPNDIRGSRSRMTELDAMELDILKLRGAFLLPPRALCDELVEAYFTWIAPIVPVVNRSRFMRQYRDPNNPPSLLLLQSILLAGSRVCYNPQLMDANGSTTPAAMTFYKRAKALYDANYEDDRVTIVQSLILMGWYWEGPEDVTKNVFYWSRVATIVAQGSGMHRSVEHSQLSVADKRLWKRIWWTLFTRDRSVAVALGRPSHINTDDSDVEMIKESDFMEDEPGISAEYPPNPMHVQFFLQYVKLCEIMGLVLAQQYSVASKYRRQKVYDLEQSDIALMDWMKHVPDIMRYHMEDKKRQNFFSAYLHMNYYTTVCLLHRAQLSNPTLVPGAHNHPQTIEKNQQSKVVAFKAAAAITSIIENIVGANELRYCPAFCVYSLFSALIMHVYQTRATNPAVVSEAQRRIKICMDALRDTSKVWIVAKMVSTLFDSIIGNKEREDRLKTTIRRHMHHRSQAHISAQDRVTEPIKRKFDEMDITNVHSSAPAPNISYERSRPQTPAPVNNGNAPTPNRGGPAQSGMDYLSSQALKPNNPSTPFAPPSIAGSPPADLFLVTRSSPPISQSLWENFQPHQLFPEDSGMANATQYSLDPSLSPQIMQGMVPTGPGQPSGSPYLSHAGQSMPGGMVSTGSPMQQQGEYPGQQGWVQGGVGFSEMDAIAAGSSPEDTWSNSSQAGVMPTALNVEDWFNFFGLNGELGGLDSHMSEAG